MNKKTIAAMQELDKMAQQRFDAKINNAIRECRFQDASKLKRFKQIVLQQIEKEKNEM